MVPESSVNVQESRLKYHKMWNAMKHGMPRDVKCHETCHVHSDSCGLTKKSTKSLYSHDEQVLMAASFISVLPWWLSNN